MARSTGFRAPATSGEVTFRRNLGSNAPDLIANLVVTSTIGAIEELVANSYDADANRVDIEYGQEASTLVIRDDGTGMSHDGLRSFYRLGDSPKIKEPISPSGRPRIGKFGVGTILLKSLCQEYELTTERGGQRTIVTERLEEKVSSDTQITGRTESTIKDAHGTQLVLRNLRFKSNGGDSTAAPFSLAELKRKLQWDLPILPDFSIYLNGEKIESKSVENGTTFSLDTKGTHMGQVRGNLYLTAKKAVMPGIHVYVNGRKVGDPKTFIDERSLATLDRVVGIVHADGLEKAILFDRGRFREDHPGVVEFGRMIEKAMKQVEQYRRSEGGRSVRGRIIARRKDFLNRARIRLSGVEGSGIDKTTKVGFESYDDRTLPGKFDQDGNKLTINDRYPTLVIDASTTPANYAPAIIAAMIDTIAMRSGSLPGFLRLRADLWSRVRPATDSEDQRSEIHPLVVYALNDLARVSGYRVGELRYLADAGAIPMREDGIVGRDFSEAAHALHGFRTLYGIVYDSLAEAKDESVNVASGISPLIERIHGILESIEESVKPFVRPFGESGAQPAYLVEETCAQEVYDLLRSPACDARKRAYDPAGAFTTLYHRSFTIPQLAKATGSTLENVSQVIGYAKQARLKIEATRTTPASFSFGDYVGVMQVKRKSDHGSKTLR